MTWRDDGIEPGDPFYVIQAFDGEGYHSSPIGKTVEDVRAKIAKRSASKVIIACSLPFQGSWTIGVQSRVPDVSLPVEWKDALASLEKKAEEE